MYSFYGGRPGNSFVIVTTFKSVDKMIEAFEQGPGYTAVHYDEYVMINTDNKNDPTNGQIYRRGYDFQATDKDDNPTGGAQYIGTIVGPAGRAPSIQICSYDEAERKYEEEPGFDKITGSGKIGGDENDDLIPGKTIENGQPKYNDEIEWIFSEVRTENGEDRNIYLGFKVPYHVFEFETKKISPYDIEGNYADTTKVEKVIPEEEENDHPFYSKWKFSIPQGIKGDSIENLRPVIDDKDKQYLYYDIRKYNEREEGKTTSHKVGPYNMIKDVNLSTQGDLTFDFTYDDSKKFGPIKWIDDVSLDDETGDFVITFNTKDGQVNAKYSTQLKWVNKVGIDSNGDVKNYYTIGQSQTVSEKTVKWVDYLALTPIGTLQVKYNTENASHSINDDTPIKWIDNITLDDKGELYVQYNTDKVDESHLINENPIKWIDKISLNNNPGETNDKYLKIEWNEGSDPTILPYNYIVSMFVDENTSHLWVKYSDNSLNTDTYNQSWGKGKDLGHIYSEVVATNPSDEQFQDMTYSGLAQVTRGTVGGVTTYKLLFGLNFNTLIPKNWTLSSVSTGNIHYKIINKSDTSDIRTGNLPLQNSSYTLNKSGIKIQGYVPPANPTAEPPFDPAIFDLNSTIQIFVPNIDVTFAVSGGGGS